MSKVALPYRKNKQHYNTGNVVNLMTRMGMAQLLAETRVGEADPAASTGHTNFILRVKQYMKIAPKVIRS
jgi:hypothetical protein